MKTIKLIKSMLQKFGIAAVLLALLFTINHPLSTARAQGTAFVFQGWLTNTDVPRDDGRHYIRFRLADSASGTNYLGPSITNNVMVQALQFTATLDFGNQFTNGASRWLEISVAKNYDAGIYDIMTPRALLSPVTSAIYAETASNLLGGITVAQLPGNVLTNTETGVTLSGAFSGNGAGLTALNAAQLNGIVPLAQLPTAVITNNDVDNLTLGGTVTADGVITADMGLTADNDITLNSGTLNLPNPATVDVGGALGILISGDKSGDNEAIGLYALSANTSGYQNTANGDYALDANTSGFANTANGYEALSANTSGFANTANGDYALFNNTRGFENTANGYKALYSNTSSEHNTANGSWALYYNTSGSYNTANGAYALFHNTSGIFNTANGADALLYNTRGNNNTAVGFEALLNLGLNAVAGGTNNIAIGYNAGGNFTGNESSNIDIGSAGVKGESGIIRIGTPGTQTTTYLSGNVYATSFNATSDRNAKENFTSINPELVLARVDSLPLTEWNYKTDKAAEHIGPMAQDFKAAFGLNGRDDKHISVVDEGGVALAAIQGLNEKAESENRKAETQIEQLKAENAELKAQLNDLATAVKSLEEKSGR